MSRPQAWDDQAQRYVGRKTHIDWLNIIGSTAIWYGLFVPIMLASGAIYSFGQMFRVQPRIGGEG